MGGAGEGEVAAVLAALAGVRHGDAVVAVEASRITRAALAAGCGQPLVDEVTALPGSAAVAVVGDSNAVLTAVLLVRPGGRLVALSADADEARRLAAEAQVTMRHTEPVRGQVAWSGQVPLESAPGPSAPGPSAP